MKLFLCSSKAFYSQLPSIITSLQERGVTVTVPNSYENPGKENEMRSKGDKIHGEWKAEMFRSQADKVASVDVILVVNLEKDKQKNYIGGSVLLEMYEAFRLNKPIYLWNPIPENMLCDEVKGMLPIIINGDISKIKV